MTTHKLLALAFAILSITSVNTNRAIAQESSVSIQVFYDELSPYGQWVDYPNYGYVWIPYGGSDFVPYSTGGYWILTDYGWTWVSDYSWGWAPFHYGRWDFDDYYGWFWVPDSEWGPSWVVWRSSPGYYGWAPMEPGISISVSFGNDYHQQSDHWVFVRDADMDRRDINHYYVNHNDHERIINITSVDKNRRSTYIAGPDKADVQKATGHKINSRTIENNPKPGEKVSNNKLNIYRPQVNKNNTAERKPAPSKTLQYKEEKHESRNGISKQENYEPQKMNENKNNAQPEKNRVIKPSENKKQSQPQKGVKPAERNKQSEPQKSINPFKNNKQNQPQNEVKPNENKQKSEPKNNVNRSKTEKQNQPQNEVKPTKSDNKRQSNKKASE